MFRGHVSGVCWYIKARWRFVRPSCLVISQTDCRSCLNSGAHLSVHSRACCLPSQFELSCGPRAQFLLLSFVCLSLPVRHCTDVARGHLPVTGGAFCSPPSSALGFCGRLFLRLKMLCFAFVVKGILPCALHVCFGMATQAPLIVIRSVTPTPR